MTEYARIWTRSPVAATLQLCKSTIKPDAVYSTISKSAGATVEEVRGAFREAEGTGLDSLVRESLQVSDAGLQPSKALYALCRILKPKIVVETGVAEGISSAFMLKALDENGRGTLYSIDRADFAENGRETGYIVPDGLRRMWEFRRGWSQQVLPSLMEELGSVDVFFHDSDHSYGVVKFEVETAYPHLRNGGTLIADDVFQTKAFFDTCRELGIKPAVIGLRIGFVRKSAFEARPFSHAG